MALMWWPVAAVAVMLLIAAIALAVLTPTKRTAQQRYPLANTVRLTRLPEYRSVVRRQLQATAMVLALTIPLFVAAVLASARPTESVLDAAGAERRTDIMLCVGQPVTDESSAEFLGYFARQVGAYGAERIGLTSTNRRVIPMTRDYQFAAGRIGEYAQLARLRADAEAGTLAPPGALTLRTRAASFSPTITYGDYAPTVADVLALCLTGFPGFEAPGDTPRSVIYLGPGDLRSPDDNRPSLYDDTEVADLARQAGARIDAVATPGRSTETLSSLASDTGGQFVRLDPQQLPAQLDEIMADLRDSGDAADRRDAPVPALLVAVAVSALLGVALMAVRR